LRPGSTLKFRAATRSLATHGLGFSAQVLWRKREIKPERDRWGLVSRRALLLRAWPDGLGVGSKQRASVREESSVMRRVGATCGRPFFATQRAG